MKRCRICQCTEARACPGGCAWTVAPASFGDVCTACYRIVGELGTILAIATKLPDSAAELGWQALWFLVCDPQGPRVRFDRWGPEHATGPHPFNRPTDPTPAPEGFELFADRHFDRLHDFAARGVSPAQAAVDQVVGKRRRKPKKRKSPGSRVPRANR